MDRYTGTRAMGMGAAFTAVADDLSAPYWNPAGLAQIRSLWFGTSGTNFYGMADRFSLDMACFIPGSKITLAGNYVQEGMSDIPRTFDVGGSGIQTGTFEEFKRVVNGSCAFPLSERLALGFNVRFINNVIDTEHAFGQSVDTGVLWRMSDDISFGCMARNVISQLEWTTETKEYYDRSLILGSGVHRNIFSIPMLWTLDHEFHPYYGYRWYTGLELWLVPKLFAFRIGTNSYPRWTLGLGLRYADLVCDVAYWTQEYLGDQFMVSLGYVFGENTMKGLTRAAPPFMPVITPREGVVQEGGVLEVGVSDPGARFQRAAVVFPGEEAIHMQREGDRFALAHTVNTVGAGQEARVYVQDNAGDVFTQSIHYTVTARPSVLATENIR